MKKVLLMLLITMFILLGCDNDNNSETPDTNTSANSQVSLNGYWNDEYSDSVNKITASELNKSYVFYNGDYLTEEKELANRKDIKYEFYTEDKLRFVNSSEGYALTIPTAEVEIDYSLSDYRVQLTFDGSILSASYENSNPYGNTLGGWTTYSTEWLNRYIANPLYMSATNEAYVDGTLVEFSNNL